MSNFWSSLFGGANSNLSNDIGQTAQLGQWATGLGQSDTGAASNFYNAILSGNQSKIAGALAPEIGQIQSSKQQNLNSLGQFGNRSGGTNAAAQSAQDQATGQINSLVGGLQSSSAGALGSLGSSLLGTGLQATSQNAQYSQQQMQNWSNSILGLGTTTAAGAAEGFLLGKL